MKTSKKFKQGDMLEIHWMDSCSTGGWMKAADIQQEIGVSACKTVGYLVHSDKLRVIVCQSLSDTTYNMAEAMSIPIVCITTVKKLK